MPSAHVSAWGLTSLCYPCLPAYIHACMALQARCAKLPPCAVHGGCPQAHISHAQRSNLKHGAAQYDAAQGSSRAVAPCNGGVGAAGGVGDGAAATKRTLSSASFDCPSELSTVT